jgi:UDPglucose 6-dehydrogenase
VEKLQTELRIMKGRTIGILGVAFKPNTDDLRDAPALDIARRLIGRGATVRAHDPVALPRARREAQLDRLSFCDSVDEIFDGADAVLLATEWPEYSNLDWLTLGGRMKSKIVVDGRNHLDSRRFASMGFTYSGIGRPS